MNTLQHFVYLITGKGFGNLHTADFLLEKQPGFCCNNFLSSYGLIMLNAFLTLSGLPLLVI